MAVILTKELIVAGDIVLSVDTSVTQDRGIGVPINASVIPYQTGIMISDALLDRYLKSEADARFAPILGNELQTFLVANGSAPFEAVNFSQLDLKTDKTDTDLKADKSNVLELDNNDAFTPIADYQPATKRFVDDSLTTRFQTGTTGQFTAASGETVTVTGGLVTGII